MKLLLLANSDWFLYRFNAELARTARAAGVETVLASPPGPHAAALAEIGDRWCPVPMARRRLRPWAELRTLVALWRLYRRERPDVVHHFTLKCVVYGALAARLAGVRGVVGSVTGRGILYTRTDRRARLLRRLLESACRLLLPGTRVIFLNRDDLADFRGRGVVSAAQSRLIRSSGVDLRRFPLLPPSPAPPVVALVARLLWSKGVGDFVAAARRLRQRGLVARFVLVGESDTGNRDAVPAAQLAAWQREEVVELWGFSDNMLAVYEQAAVICLPTFYREGVPTVLLEAAACGRPAVASDVPGCREAVVAGETGLLVPPRDVEALASALATLVADPALRQWMGEAGRRHAASFAVERVVAETLAVYRDAGLGIPSTAPDERAATSE